MRLWRRDKTRASAVDPFDVEDNETVSGERGQSIVHRALSMQSRVSRILVLGTVGVFALGLLIWYYVHAFDRTVSSRSDTKVAASAAAGDSTLPPIGRIAPPALAESPTDSDAGPSDESEVAALLASSGGSDFHHPLSAPETSYPSVPAEKTPEQLTLERRLSGAPFSGAMNTRANFAQAEESETTEATSRTSALATLLEPSLTPAARARLLPTRRFLLPKGAFIDCTLETAIDSSLPGMTTCITATDTFGADGNVVLLERGTKLIGETQGQVQQGNSRLFVLWTEARTPAGVVVPLDSPGADELGRSGLPGEVNRHFWDRFGAAILISTLDGVTQSLARSEHGAVIYNPSSSRDLMAEVLKETANIPPTLVKAQGDRIQILVARDVDFRSVYELHTQRADD